MLTQLFAEDFNFEKKACLAFIAIDNPNRKIPLIDPLVSWFLNLAKEKGYEGVYAEATHPKSKSSFEWLGFRKMKGITEFDSLPGTDGVDEIASF